MARELWDCWDDVETPATTGTSGTPPTTGAPEVEEVCYPPRIDHMSIAPSVEVQMFIS